MKKNFISLIMVAVSTISVAQNCRNTTITPSFDSECVITNFGRKPENRYFLLDETKCNTVCTNSTVTYTIKVDVGSEGVTWSVVGAVGYTVLDSGKIEVQWGDDGNTEGSVGVEILGEDGSTYTETLCVRLIARPPISSTTIPPANIVGNISVCRGESVTFINTTTAETGDRPIVGHFWEVTGPNNFFEIVTDNNYIFNTSISGTYTVTHTVINSCGCDTTETYTVHVREMENDITLSCYGTVCAETLKTYSVINPQNNSYHWIVENGQILSGQNTPNITIFWGDPPEGYGIITIRTGVSQQGLCQKVFKIPIIPTNAIISGPDMVCLGESHIYNTTLWGSTKYEWQVTYNNYYYNNYNYHEIQNGILYTFHNIGTDTIILNYYNYFLDCEGKAKKTVVVLPRLEINTSKSTVCINAPITLTTNMAQTLSEWLVFDNYNNQIYSTHSSTLTYTFTAAGKYRITASNSNACNTATYIITVKSPPPPPDIISISGPNAVCPNASYAYSGIPSHPDYVLLWKLAYPCNSPVYTGNTVSIPFGNPVCNILVYQQDVTSGCISDSTLFKVDSLKLGQIDDKSKNVCKGGIYNVSAPHQDFVFYNWVIEPVNGSLSTG